MSRQLLDVSRDGDSTASVGNLCQCLITNTVTTGSSTPPSHPPFLTLMGIPGLEAVQHWIGIPFSLMYATALLGNGILLATIQTERSLHQPMFILLAMLAATDLGLCSTIMPKMLGIFWFSLRDIHFNACLTQMFFVHTFQATESGVLLAMAFDRFVAICKPLRHSTILSNQVLRTIGIILILRPTILIAPSAFLIKQLRMYRSTVISHSYCEHMAVVKIAAGDVWVNKVYGLFVAFIILGFDLVLIIVSYVLIFRAVFQLPQRVARLKAMHTCTAHLCVFLEFYTLGFFSFLAHRFGHGVSPYVHILLSSFYLLVPPTLNPIIYGISNTAIRQRVQKMIGLKA
ncbi:olfactory receptor 52A1-like [Rhea pennata]|uniref:olfactory receptor 52A1-like n=1 Tax=Rhea pennata TaxID=8795 RepID=UPI002E264DB0